MTLRAGQRVEMHPGTNLWMRGARYGNVIRQMRSSVAGNFYLVQLDKLARPVKVAERNLIAVNPKTHTAKFDRCVRKVKRRRGRKKVRNAFAVCAAKLGRAGVRKRRHNPSRYHTNKARGVGRGRYIITARKPGGALLRFVSGNKFAERGNPIVFPSHQSASITARLLRRMFPVLKRYAPRATPHP